MSHLRHQAAARHGCAVGASTGDYVVLVSLGGDVTGYIRRQGHGLEAIRPWVLSVVAIRIVGIVGLRISIERSAIPGWLPLINQKSASTRIVAIVDVGAVFQLMSLNLSMHLAGSWVRRSALSTRLRLIAVSERLAREQSKVVL